MEEDLVQIRKALGIGQNDLAKFLGIHRSLVNHAERGDRQLPVKALDKAMLLQITLEGFSEEEKPETLRQFEETQRTKIQKQYALKARKVLKQLESARERLEECRSRYRQAALRFEVVENTNPENSMEQNWLDWLLSDGQVLLEKYGLEAQNQLEIQIELLETEARLYQTKALS